MVARWFSVLALVVLVGCSPAPVDFLVDFHILPSGNHGCEIICKNGVATITCPYKGGCKREGEAICVIESGEIRNRMACCPMYTVCKCSFLKDGIYKGYCKDGVCTYRIPVQ